MYKTLLILILVLGVVGSSALADLRGHWELDGNALDSSGYGNNGTAVNTPTPTADRFGNPNGAMYFDGVTFNNDAFDCGNDWSVQIDGAMTITAWVYLDSSNPNYLDSSGRVLSKLGIPGGVDWSYSLNVENGESGIPGRSAFMLSPDGSGLVALNDDVQLTADQWVHMAGVFTPGVSMEIYLDGVLAAIKTDSIPASQYSAGSGHLYLGSFQGGDNVGWCGALDDIRLYSDALTQEQIQAIMTGVPVVKANTPSPSDAATGVGINDALSWTAGAYSVSHDVYFGTDQNAVMNAQRLLGDINGDGPADILDLEILASQWLTDPGDTNPSADIAFSSKVDLEDFAALAADWGVIPDSAFIGNQLGTTFDPGTMDSNVTYYWRVDEVNGAEPDSPWTGNVWSFTTGGTGIIKIMPLGDSITQGYTTYDNYRHHLWNKLQAYGYSNVNFVGSHDVLAWDTSDSLVFDKDHEGHYGWQTDEIRDGGGVSEGGSGNLTTWLTGLQTTNELPDIVLMHLGTNDVVHNSFGYDQSITIGEMEDVIDILRSFNPNVTILLAKIIPHKNAALPSVDALNALIPALDSYETATSEVIIVDHYTGFQTSWLADDYHPNATGATEMSNRWFDALLPLLGQNAIEPAGYWELDEPSGSTAYDSSGNGNDGTLVNMDDSDWVRGIVGNALDFDGTDDYVVISGYKGVTGENSRTCTAWIKTSLSGNVQMITSWGASATGQAWMVYIDQNGKLNVNVYGGSVTGTAVLNDGSWHHVTVVLREDLNADGRIWVEDIRLYVDGLMDPVSSVSSGSDSGAQINSSSDIDVTLGVRNYGELRPDLGYSFYFQGLIDDVRIYDYVLSAEEIYDMATVATGRKTLNESVTGRRYILYVPTDYNASHPYPLIISSHGTNQNGDTEMDSTGPNSGWDQGTPTWPELVDMGNNVIVACPDMTGAYGESGCAISSTHATQLAADDTAIMAIIAEIVSTYNIDSSKIMLTGFSGGGNVVHYVGLRHPDVFKGICSRHGNFHTDLVPSSLPAGALDMPVFIFTREQDITCGNSEAISWYQSAGFNNLETATYPTIPDWVNWYDNHVTDRHYALDWFLSIMKPRVIVCSDIGGGDPDDFQSMVHYLVNADRFETEGLISSPPMGGRASDILATLNAYETDYSNLNSHADFPTPQSLRDVTKQGAINASPSAGYSTPTEGSNWIISCANSSDPRPLWILVWGSITDVAQAVHDDPSIKSKIRVYSIGSWNTDQDPYARNYLYNNHSDLWWIENDSTFFGMWIGGDQSGDLGNSTFVENHVRYHGALGDFYYSKMNYIKMGDTPSVLYMLNGDPDDPTTAHWGGMFGATGHGSHYWTDLTDPQYEDTNYFTIRTYGAKTVNVWREDYLRDWQTRMDWADAP